MFTVVNDMIYHLLNCSNFPLFFDRNQLGRWHALIWFYYHTHVAFKTENVASAVSSSFIDSAL